MAITIYYNGQDVTGQSVQIPLGSTAVFTAVTTGETIDRWFSSTVNDSVYTMTYSGSTCYVTPVAVGEAAYGIYCWPTSGSSVHIGIEVVDESSGGGDSGSTATVSQIFCLYNGSYYSDGDTISVSTGTTLNFTAYVIMSDGTTDSAGVYWLWGGSDYGYLTKNSSSITTASYTATSAGTQDIVLLSKTDTTQNITITVVVSGSSTKEIDHIFAIYDGNGYTSDFSIEVNVGDSFTLSAYAEYSDGSIDSAQGVDFVFYSSQTVISCDSESTSSVTCTALEAGTTSIFIMSNRTPTVNIDVTINVVDDSSPSLTGVRVSWSGEDGYRYDDFQIDISMDDSSTSLVVVSTYSDDSIDSTNTAFTLMSGSSYITITEYRSNLWVITPKAVGKALIKAYCTDDEDLNILIILNVYQDETTGTLGYAAYICDGSSWSEYTPYIYDSTNGWMEYAADICDGTSWTIT